MKPVSTVPHRRFGWLIAAPLTLILARSVPAQQTFNDTLHFTTSGQSQWWPGQGNIQYSLYLPRFGGTPETGLLNWDTGNLGFGGYYNPGFGPWHVDPCFGIFGGCGFDIPRVELGDFGARVTARSSGKIGLGFEAGVDGGSVNVSYPVKVTLQCPGKDDLAVGDPFILTSTFQVDRAASLTTTRPSAYANLYAIFQTSNSANLNAKIVGRDIINYSPPLPNFNERRQLLDTRLELGSNLYKPFDLFNKGFVTGYIKFPQLNASGGLADPNHPEIGNLSASSYDTFFSMRGSITNLLASLFGWSFSLPVNANLGFDFGFASASGGLTASLDLLQLGFQTNFGLRQTLTLQERPTIHLELSAPVQWEYPVGIPRGTSAVIEFYAGDSVRIFMPATSLTLRPTYTLNNGYNRFKNTVNVVLDGGFKFDPLRVRASAGAHVRAGIGPLNVDANFKLASFDWTPYSWTFLQTNQVTLFPIWNKEFALQGFQNLRRPDITIAGHLHDAPTLASASPDRQTMFIINDNRQDSYQDFLNHVNGLIPITLHGANFRSTATAFFSHHGQEAALPTQYVNATTLNVQLPGWFLLLPGTGRLKVTVPNSLGPSNSLDLPIEYPVPFLAAAGFNVWASDPHFDDLLLPVRGEGFFNRYDYFFSPDHNYPLRLLQKYWLQAFHDLGPMPLYFPDFDFTRPAPMPTVYWDGKPLSSYVESAPSGFFPSLLPREYFDRSRRVPVYIINPGPGGGQSNTVNVLIGGPTPLLTGTEPTTVSPGDPGFRMVIKGLSSIPLDAHDINAAANGFVADSVVTWNGQPRLAKFVSASELEIDVPASDVAVGADNVITVSNPYTAVDGTHGTHVSAPVTFTVRNPVPAITARKPETIFSADPAFRGDPAYNLAVEGSGFVPNSVVTWNGVARPTRYVSGSTLEATLSPSDIALPTTGVVSVYTPPPGGGFAPTVTVSVVNAAPQATRLTPESVTVRGGDFGISVEGSGFFANSVVYWNGRALATTFQDANILLAHIPASYITQTGDATVTVVNPAPGGGTSNGLALHIAGYAVSGTIMLEGIVTSAPAQPLTLTFRPTGGGTPITRPANVGPDGAFSVSDIPPATYTLSVKGAKWLRRSVSLDLSAGAVTGAALLLAPGDVNNDNAVDLDDLGLLALAFNTTGGDSLYDARADLNCDGAVDLDDLGLLALHFNESGDP